LDLDPKAAQWQLLGIYRSIEYSATPALAQLLLHPVPWKMQDAEATGRLAFFFAVMPLLFWPYGIRVNILLGLLLQALRAVALGNDVK
jgi:hypothetical protein